MYVAFNNSETFFPGWFSFRKLKRFYLCVYSGRREKSENAVKLKHHIPSTKADSVPGHRSRLTFTLYHITVRSGALIGESDSTPAHGDSPSHGACLLPPGRRRYHWQAGSIKDRRNQQFNAPDFSELQSDLISIPRFGSLKGPYLWFCQCTIFHINFTSQKVIL